MKPTKKRRIFCFGDLCMDVVAEPDGSTPTGAEASLRHLATTVAGAAVNCATAAVQQHAEVHLIGNLGRDHFGEIIAAYLFDNQIGSEHVARVAGRTGTVLALLTPSGERTLHSYRGVNALACESLPESFAAGDFVYLSGYSFQDGPSRAAAVELKNRAQASGALCVLDPSFQFASHFRRRYKDTLRGVQLVFPNLDEARLMTGCRSPADCACLLRDSGASVAIITLGSEGCYLDSSEYRGTIPGRAVERPANTTGAGDAFCGAMLAALSQGASLRQAAGRANEYASRLVENLAPARLQR